MGEYLLMIAQAHADLHRADPQGLREALVYNERAGECFPPKAKPSLWFRQRQWLLSALGEEAAAKQVATEGVTAQPRTAQEHYLTGLDLYREGRYPDAVAALQKGVAQDPQHFRAHFLMGNCYYRLQDNTKAAGSYSICISLNPRHAKARFNHGKVLALARHYGPAFEEFSRALELDPSSIDTRIERALTAAQLGRLLEAQSDLTDVLQRPDAPTYVYFRRATVRDRLKDKAGAAADRAEGLRNHRMKSVG
jgi:tetratricopeptide (TPR) repeat protein